MPTSTKEILAENLLRIRERIAKATEAAARPLNSVQLVAVTKYVDVATTIALLESGCETLGESRPQQLNSKAAEPALAHATWHLIGHLQRNKVRATLPHAQLIHSVDSLRLLETIDRVSAEQHKSTEVLLEVNCSGDAEKHGLTAHELLELVPQIPKFEHIKLCGLMTMAAREGGEIVAAENFAELRKLRDEAQQSAPEGVELQELSMGMSHDFEVAIREGATIVRIGSLLFQGIP